MYTTEEILDMSNQRLIIQVDFETLSQAAIDSKVFHEIRNAWVVINNQGNIIKNREGGARPATELEAQMAVKV